MFLLLGACASPVPFQGPKEHENMRTRDFIEEMDCLYF